MVVVRTQRERLLAGVVAAANRGGYARANVSAVIAEAGVSRRTFYDVFADRDDCFLAALAGAQEQLLGEISRMVAAERPERAMYAAVGALVAFAGERPTLARFLMNEAMAGGPGALDARDGGIAAIDRLIERSYRRAEAAALVPDFSGRMLLGGVYRVLASRLRRAEPNASLVLADLLGWVGSYERPLGERRWRALQACAAPARSPFVPEVALRAPEPLAPGRPRSSEEEDVAESQRRRIMFAAAGLAEEKGYAASTVAEITKLAGVDGRVFYGMFADKQDAFMAVHEFGFQHVMDVTAAAFFAGESWPERNWEAGRAFTQFLEHNPLVAHVGFVESYAVGPGAAQRLEDSQSAFTMLLQEGYQYVGEDSRPSRLALEAIIATIFETVYQRARAGGRSRLSGLLGHLTFLVLSPFIGAGEANAFIDQKLGVQRADSAERRRLAR